MTSQVRRVAGGASVLSFVALVGIVACAQSPLAPGEPREVERVVIAPYAMHEECAHLAAGERLDYRYRSSEPLDFSIHYHENDAVLSPLVREGSMAESGTFEASAGQDYCLLWQAGPPGAIIGYRVLVRPTPIR